MTQAACQIPGEVRPSKTPQNQRLRSAPLFAGWIDVAKESATTSEVLNSKASSRSLPAELMAPPPADAAPAPVPEPERTFSGAPLAPKTGGDDSEPDPDRAERHPYVARPGDRSKPVSGLLRQGGRAGEPIELRPLIWTPQARGSRGGANRVATSHGQR